MIDIIRIAAKSFILKAILVIFIVSVILNGLVGESFFFRKSKNYAAKVNGQEISLAQFENAFAIERSIMQHQLGDQFYDLAANNDAYIKTLRQQTLNRLIDKTMLSQFALHLGLGISDEQVKKAILATPSFQSNGMFDNSRYHSIINQMGISVEQYAQVLRNQLMTQQLINALVGTNFMLKGETEELTAMMAQQRIFREATIDVNALAVKQQISDVEVTDYYLQNQNRFIAPEQFRVSYIKLNTVAMQENASDVEIQSYYDQHQAQFTRPQRKRYSMIQTKTEADAKDVLDELKMGADFVALAKAKSTDIVSAKNGGDLGWLEEPATPDELKNADLKEKGQLSEIIKSSVGFLVARLDDIKSAEIKPLAEVHDDIVAKVKQEKALYAYYALQQKVSDAASNDNESLMSAEKVAGVKAVETNWFSRDSLPEELNFKPVYDAIFNGNLVGENGTPGGNSAIINVDDDSSFVLRVAKHKPETVKPLEEVKEQITALVKHNKAERQAKLYADKLLAELKAGNGNYALKLAGLNFSEARTMSRTGHDPVIQAVFSLSLPVKDKPSYGVTCNMQGNVVLLALDKVISGTMPEIQKKTMVQRFIQNNAQIVVDALISNLRKEAQIKLGDVIKQ